MYEVVRNYDSFSRRKWLTKNKSKKKLINSARGSLLILYTIIRNMYEWPLNEIIEILKWYDNIYSKICAASYKILVMLKNYLLNSTF